MQHWHSIRWDVVPGLISQAGKKKLISRLAHLFAGVRPNGPKKYLRFFRIYF
jgi:hypothetical protein